MQPTYLYIKQHGVTGLKYFGKTIHDPNEYLGSGRYWLSHINKHGKEHVRTIWTKLFTDTETLTTYAKTFSEENDIVKSDTWANLMEENGSTGGPVSNNHLRIYNTLPKTDKFKEDLSIARRGTILTPNAYNEIARIRRSETLKSYPILQCPYCGKEGRYIGRFKGFHFEKCKSHPLIHRRGI